MKIVGGDSQTVSVSISSCRNAVEVIDPLVVFSSAGLALAGAGHYLKAAAFVSDIVLLLRWNYDQHVARSGR